MASSHDKENLKKQRNSVEKANAISPMKKQTNFDEEEYAEDEFEKANDSPLKQNRQQYNGDLNLQNVSRNA